jgi:CheY-like chemotaxis protein
VEVELLPPTGTRVTLQLGSVQRPLRDTPRSSEAIAIHVGRLWGSIEGIRDRTILVAEDEESLRRLLASYLKDLHATVTFVNDARAAREAIEREPFDLFITDAVMPGGGTLAAIDEFRRRNRRGAVLVVSGHVREDLIRRGIETGTVSFLPKPFTRVQLLEAIARAIRPARPPAMLN